MSRWVEPEWPRERHLMDSLVHVVESEHPGAKVIAWLHNSHVAVETPPDGEPRMGRQARDRFGSAYSLALEFGHGDFQTREITRDGQLGELVVTVMPRARPGSLPWRLGQADSPSFVVPLRGTSSRSHQVDHWLGQAQLEHGGMWIAADPETLYEDVVVGEQYDSILFVRRVTSSHPTPSAQDAAAAGFSF